MPRQPRSLWTRLLALYLLWIGVRAAWFFFLAESDPNFKLAGELGFGAHTRIAQLLVGGLGITAAVWVWWGNRRAVMVGGVALALYAAANLTGLRLARDNPEAAKRAYVASRVARSLPVPPEARLNQVFSRETQSSLMLLALGMSLVPLAVLWWRRGEFED